MSPTSTVFLPTEVLEIVVRKAADTDIRSGQEWLGRVNERGQQCWDLLRALSQTCRSLRRVAMPLMWEEVVVDAAGENWGELRRQLRLLTQLLEFKRVRMPRASQKFGPLLKYPAFRQPRGLGMPLASFQGSPARWVKKVRINVAYPDDEGEVEVHGNDIGPKGIEVDIDGRETRYKFLTKPITARRYSEQNFRTTKHLSCVLMQKFSQTLARRCPRLQYVSWDGWLVPDEVLTSRFASIPSLLAFQINLGPRAKVHQTQDGWQIESGKEWNRLIWSPALSLEEHLENANSGEINFPGGYCDCCEDSLAYGKFVSRKGAAAVDWLIAIGMPTQLSLAIPELLRKAWMVPVWAQMDDMVWHFVWEREHPEEKKGYVDLDDRPWWDGWPWEFLDEHSDRYPTASRFFKAAASFRGHLFNVPCPRNAKELTQAARMVFDVIHSEPDLAPWRPWFVEWESTALSHGGESTQTVLKKVVKALWRNV